MVAGRDLAGEDAALEGVSLAAFEVDNAIHRVAAPLSVATDTMI